MIEEVKEKESVAGESQRNKDTSFYRTHRLVIPVNCDQDISIESEALREKMLMQQIKLFSPKC